MPVSIAWDDEAQTTVRYDYVGKWVWEEVYAVYDKANAMIASVPYPVSIIHNLAESEGSPSGALTHARRITMSIPENWDTSVVVGSGAFTESLLSIFSKVYRKLGDHYKTAHTLDEARAIISKHRAT